MSLTLPSGRWQREGSHVRQLSLAWRRLRERLPDAGERLTGT